MWVTGAPAPSYLVRGPCAQTPLQPIPYSRSASLYNHLGRLRSWHFSSRSRAERSRVSDPTVQPLEGCQIRVFFSARGKHPFLSPTLPSASSSLKCSSLDFSTFDTTRLLSVSYYRVTALRRLWTVFFFLWYSCVSYKSSVISVILVNTK